MARDYYEQKLESYQIAKQILNAGTEILVSNLVDQSGTINFDRLRAILDAYEEARDDIDKSIEWYREHIDGRDNPPADTPDQEPAPNEDEKGNEE